MGNSCTAECATGNAETLTVDAGKEPGTDGTVTQEKATDGTVTQEKAREAPEPTRSLTIDVVSCRGLRNADWSWILGKGVSDAYVIAKVGEKEILRTKTIPNTLEPIFDEEFAVPLPDVSADIVFEVWDKDNEKLDDKLGCATLKLDNFMEKGYNGELELKSELKDAVPLKGAYIKLMVKLPFGAYPEGPAAEFKVTLKKAKNAAIGFEVDASDPAYLLIVTDGAKFKGAAKEHNESAESWMTQLKKFQSIFAVNGVSGDVKKMKELLKTEEEVTLTIRRPYVFTTPLEVDKKKGLGATLADAPPTSCLVKEIDEAKESPIQVWNANHTAKQVQKGDRIVSVNQKMGTGKELSKALKTGGTKQILFLRPATPGVLTQFVNTWF